MPLGAATPVAIFTAGGAIAVPASLRIIDFWAHNTTGAAQAGATVRAQSSIAPAGFVDVTDAVVISFNDGVGHCTTIDPAQSSLIAADSLQLVKNAAGDGGIAYLLMHLT